MPTRAIHEALAAIAPIEPPATASSANESIAAIQMEAVAHRRHMHPPRRVHHAGNEEHRHRGEPGALPRGIGEVAMSGGEGGEFGGAVGH